MAEKPARNTGTDAPRAGDKTGEVARDLLTTTNAGHDTIAYREAGDAPVTDADVDQTVRSESMAAALDDQKRTG